MNLKRSLKKCSGKIVQCNFSSGSPNCILTCGLIFLALADYLMVMVQEAAFYFMFPFAPGAFWLLLGVTSCGGFSNPT